MSYAQFAAARRAHQTQYFENPGATTTVMVCSHIWWADHLAAAFFNAGYNVFISLPFFRLYTDDDGWERFDFFWDDILRQIKQRKVSLIIGGNTSAMALHPKTRERIHRAAGVPVMHYWWDEPRARPPLARRGFTPEDYLSCLRDECTVNVLWDMDVLEELETFLGLTNGVHLPLATWPEYWPWGYVPMADRALAACFLGNCHYAVDWAGTQGDPQIAWARAVVEKKRATLDGSMRDFAVEGGRFPEQPGGGGDAWARFFRRWELVNSLWMHWTRNLMVQRLAAHLEGKLALIGSGWERLGLRANGVHAQERSGVIYSQSKASLNLFGGCVHGGMPLRPFDIAASGGLVLTHYQRELPSLLEPGKECLAFRSAEEMLDTVDRVLASPAEFDEVAMAGRKRVLAEHTWEHRVRRLVETARARLGWAGRSGT